MSPKHNLTCILQHLNSKKVVRSKILIQNVLNYYDFIRREGLSVAIWFDIVESAFGENIRMTVKIFADVHQLFLALKLVWIRIEYSLA